MTAHLIDRRCPIVIYLLYNRSQMRPVIVTPIILQAPFLPIPDRFLMLIAFLSSMKRKAVVSGRFLLLIQIQQSMADLHVENRSRPNAALGSPQQLPMSVHPIY